MIRPYLFIVPFLFLLFSCRAKRDEEADYNEVFVLQFSEGSSVAYHYHVEQAQNIDLDCEKDESMLEMIIDGTIEIVGESDEEAVWKMFDVNSETSSEIDGEEHVNKTTNDKAFAIEKSGLQRDGSFTVDDSRMNIFHMVFTLPQDDMEVGDVLDEELHFPVNLSGVSSYIIGSKTITYEKDTLINGVNCAVLTYTTSNQGLKKISSFTDDSYGVLKGSGMSYFNYENGVFIGAKSHLYVEVYAELNEEDEFVSCMDMTMDSKNEVWILE